MTADTNAGPTGTRLNPAMSEASARAIATVLPGCLKFQMRRE